MKLLCVLYASVMNSSMKLRCAKLRNPDVQIGGKDITIETKLVPEEAIRRSAETVLSLWPEGTVEVDETKHDISVFIYRSVQARIAWDKHGWGQGHARDMIYLLAGDPGSITLVVEDLDTDLGQIVDKIRGILS
jgi:hypothetical protein